MHPLVYRGVEGGKLREGGKTILVLKYCKGKAAQSDPVGPGEKAGFNVDTGGKAKLEQVGKSRLRRGRGSLNGREFDEYRREGPCPKRTNLRRKWERSPAIKTLTTWR